MASTPTITFDGTNINTFGAYINSSDAPGWLSSPEIVTDVSDLVGAVGGVVASTDSVKARRINLPIAVTATTMANQRSYEATLKGYERKDVVLKIDDGANAYEITGRVGTITLTPYKVPVSPRSDGVVPFTCADPLWRATSNTTETINGTPNSADLGSAPVSDWVLTITPTGGNITDVTITFGAYTLTWTGTIVSTKSLIISAAAFTVTNDGVTAISTYVGGWPTLDPRSAPSVSGVKGSGAGTFAATLVYKKRYW